MKKTVLTLLCLTLLLTFAFGDMAAFAATQLKPTQIQVNNNTGASITEIYIYPNYTTKVGDARNKGLYDTTENKKGDQWQTVCPEVPSGIISITEVEARRDCLWNMTVVFKPQGGYAFRCNWEDLDLSDYLGQVVEFTVTDDGHYMMSTVSLADNIAFSVYNDTGFVISEVYFYTLNSTSFGLPRNTKQLRDQDSIDIKFNSVESSSSAQWCLRAMFPIDGWTYYVEFEDVDLTYYNGGTMVMSINRDGELYLYLLEGML